MKKLALLFSLALGAVLLSACGEKSPAAPTPIEMPTTQPSATTFPSEVSGKELIACVDDEAAAKALAEQYGIDFISFADGVAVFSTEEEPESVIARGKDKGWPELSINRPVSAS